MTKAVQILINGKVQGVWFRKSTKQQAEQLKIKGTVQNLNDGRVKVQAVGELENLDRFIAWLKVGPQYAKVESISIHDIDPPNAYVSFEIIR